MRVGLLKMSGVEDEWCKGSEAQAAPHPLPRHRPRHTPARTRLFVCRRRVLLKRCARASASVAAQRSVRRTPPPRCQAVPPLPLPAPPPMPACCAPPLPGSASSAPTDLPGHGVCVPGLLQQLAVLKAEVLLKPLRALQHAHQLLGGEVLGGSNGHGRKGKERSRGAVGVVGRTDSPGHGGCKWAKTGGDGDARRAGAPAGGLLRRGTAASVWAPRTRSLQLQPAAAHAPAAGSMPLVVCGRRDAPAPPPSAAHLQLPLERAVGEQVGKGVLALRAPRLLLVQRPVQDAGGAVHVVAALQAKRQ